MKDKILSYLFLIGIMMIFIPLSIILFIIIIFSIIYRSINNPRKNNKPIKEIQILFQEIINGFKALIKDYFELKTFKERAFYIVGLVLGIYIGIFYIFSKWEFDKNK